MMKTPPKPIKSHQNPSKTSKFDWIPKKCFPSCRQTFRTGTNVSEGVRKHFDSKQMSPKMMPPKTIKNDLARQIHLGRNVSLNSRARLGT